MAKDKRPNSDRSDASKKTKRIKKSLTHEQLIVFPKPKKQPKDKQGSSVSGKPSSNGPKKC